MATKTTQKFYVVWKGRLPGIYTTWEDAEKQVRGYAGAEYKAFASYPEANAAFKANYSDFMGKPATQGKWKTASVKPRIPSVCVDAACSGSPGKLEYRGVDLGSGEEIFHAGPYEDGTNNVGEFLAIVHALSWLERHKKQLPIYSDSENAMIWVHTGECKTGLKHTEKNGVLFALIHSAENWLAENELPEDGILKWDTALWGENPADFGRK